MSFQCFESRCRLEPGKVLKAFSRDGVAKRFYLKCPIGIGGNGEVWKAVSKDNLDAITVKFFSPFIPPDREVNEEKLKRLKIRFCKEAIHVKDAPVDTTPEFRGLFSLGDKPYYAVEYRKGITLSKLIRERSLNFKARALIFNKLCSTVYRLHSEMLHLDLKPSNILVTLNSEVLLLDFGSSLKLKELRSFYEGKDLIYTPRYASPELRKHERLTVRSDVFALGCILFELFSNKVLLKDKTSIAERVKNHLNSELGKLVISACRTDPDKRFNSVETLRREFLNSLQVR